MTASWHGNEPVPCDLVQFGATFAQVRLPAAAALPVGMELELRLTKPGERPRVAQMAVEHRVGAVTRCRVVGGSIDEAWVSEVVRLLNRRATVRIRPPHPVFVSVVAEGGRGWNGPLWDLSVGGLSVVLDGRARPEPGLEVVARFALPGDPERFALPGSLSPRGVVMGGERWAVAFDSGALAMSDRRRLEDFIAEHGDG